MFIKMKIKGKIVSALFLMAIITFGTMMTISLINMRGLSYRAFRAATELGESAIAESKHALVEKSKNELMSLAKDQATITNLLFERINSEIENIARIYVYLRAYSTEADEVMTDSVTNADKIYPGVDPKSLSYYSAAPGVDPAMVKEEMKFFSQMHNVFKFTFASSPHLDLIYLGTSDGIFFQYPWFPVPKDYDPRTRPWYKDALESKSAVEWTGPYVSSGKKSLVLTCSKAVWGKNKKNVTVLAADINVKIISKEFISTQLSEDGYAFLVDDDGNIVAREGLASGRLEWTENYEKENLASFGDPALKRLVKEMTSGRSGIIECRWKEGKSFFIAYAPIKATGWSIGISRSVDSVLKSAVKTEKAIKDKIDDNEKIAREYIERNKILYFIVGCVILLLILYVGLLISRRITAPILVLKDMVHDIGGGNLDKRINLNTSDEIEELADTYDRMRQDLKTYISDLQRTTSEKERIETDLKIASRIQLSMLPAVAHPFPEHPEIEIYACMCPAKQVGGDFYDFFFLDPTHLFFCIGDVSGKGVPSALFMAITKTLIKAAAVSGVRPNDIYYRVNNILQDNNEDCMFATSICGVLNTQTGELEYSNAGHNPPLKSDVNGTFEYIKIEHGVVIGPMPQERDKYPIGKIFVERDGVIVFYTDGVTEAVNTSKELFTEARLKNTLNKIGHKAASCEIVDGVKASVFEYTGEEPQFDDISMLVIKFKGRA